MMRWLVPMGGLVELACASALPQPAYSVQPPSALRVVPYEPPPGRIEVVPHQPRSDAVWVDGEWNWTYRRWVWTPGRWVVAPPGATYSPWAAIRGRDAALYFAPAMWHDPGGAILSPPRALATATVPLIPVVDSEGFQARTLVAPTE